MTKMELAKKLTVVMDSRKKFETVVNRLNTLLPPSMPGAEDMRNKITDLLDICMDDLIDAHAKVYSELFNEDELKELIEVHSTPAMIKFEEQQAELSKRMDYYTKAVIMKHTASMAFNEGYQEEPRESSPLGGFGLLPTDIDDKNLN